MTENLVKFTNRVKNNRRCLNKEELMKGFVDMVLYV